MESAKKRKKKEEEENETLIRSWNSAVSQ